MANLGLGADPLTRNSYTFLNGMSVNEYDPTGHAGSHALAADVGGGSGAPAWECLYAQSLGGTECPGSMQATPEQQAAELAQIAAEDRATYMHDTQSLQLLQLRAQVQQLEDFLSSLAKLATGCVTSPSGLLTCTGALIAPVAPEVGAGLIALGGIPNDVNCVQTHDPGSCAAGVASVVPGAVELAGPLKGAIRGGLDALGGGAARTEGPVTDSLSTGPQLGAPQLPATDAGVGAAARNGRPFLQPVLNEEEYATSQRLTAQPAFSDRIFAPSGDPANDIVDELGQSYELIGGPKAAAYWGRNDFLKQLARHLQFKRADYLVVDYTGFSMNQARAAEGVIAGGYGPNIGAVIRIGP